MFHCDWLNIWQEFPDWAGPELFGGRVVSVTGSAAFGRRLTIDDHGEFSEQWSLSDVEDVDYSTAKFHSHRGSFETNLLIRFVGGRLEVRGNPSSYGRLDNVFGLSLDSSISALNGVMSELGLPLFTTGQHRRVWLQSTEKWSDVWTGAHLSRVDMTANLAVGMGHVVPFHKWLASQKLYRSAMQDEQLQKVVQWDWKTVYLSASKYYLNVKCYDKSAALQDVSLPEYEKRLKQAVRDGKISKGAMLQLLDEASDYINKLSAWCAEIGMARLEYSFKSRFIAQSEEMPGYWVPGVSEQFFIDRACVEFEKIGKRAVVYQGDAMDNLTSSEKGWLSRWEEGRDVRELMPKSSFCRIRASILKKTGHDIGARPLAVKTRQQPVYFQIRSLSLADAPTFYRAPLQQAV